MTQDTAKIREFLIKQFNDGELDDLCFDHFPKVYDIIGGMDKSNKIRRLMDYCRRNGEFPRLLNLLKALRPAPYDEVFPTPKPEPDPPPPPVMQHPKGDNPAEAQGILRSADYAQNDMVSPPSVMLTLSNTKGKHPDGSDSAEAQGILRSADYAQNDRGWMRWLARLRTVPMPVWGVAVVLLVSLAWIAYNSLNGNNPPVTPIAQVTQNSPAATQPVPPSATPEPTATPDPNMPPPNAQLGATWTRPTDGMVMVYVPAGAFLMGSADSDPNAFDNEKPQHEVTLDGFWIDRTEVTNEQYGLCVQAGDCEASRYEDEDNWNGDNYPVVGVSWNDADAYCQWAGGSLPTEAQWEYAARGPENRIYPWGDEFDGRLLNFCDNNCTYDLKDTSVDDEYELTAPVGSYPDGQSRVGAMDMAGNVWEWVADWYDENYYSNSPNQDPLGPETGSKKVARGGSWYYDQPILRAAYRLDDTPSNRSNGVGIRCLLQPDN